MSYLLQQYQEVSLILPRITTKRFQEYDSFDFIETLMLGLAGSASASFTLRANRSSVANAVKQSPEIAASFHSSQRQLHPPRLAYRSVNNPG